MSDDFANPAELTNFSWEDHNGALLILEPFDLEKGIQTVNGVRDAVRAAVSVVDGTDAGSVYPDVFVFPKVVFGQLRPNLGKKVLGRLGQGSAKAGQKPPWKLLDATAADTAAARAFSPARIVAADTDMPAPAPGYAAPAGNDPLAGMDPATRSALAALAAQQKG